MYLHKKFPGNLGQLPSDVENIAIYAAQQAAEAAAQEEQAVTKPPEKAGIGTIVLVAAAIFFAVKMF